MQRIINALAKNKNLVLYLILLIISISFLTSRSHYHQTKIGKISIVFSSAINNLFKNISRYSNLNNENKILLKENLILKVKELENNYLLKNYKKIENQFKFPFSVKLARIIKNNYKFDKNYLIINKGIKDGVKIEMGVISSEGIVGIINQVTENYSSVISILHSDIKINTKFKNTDFFGTLSWDGKMINKMILEDIVSTEKVFIGDTIVSGGMSSYFPSDIPIGKVSSFSNSLKKGYYSIQIDLFNNPKNWEYVYLLENTDFKEIYKLPLE
jgi:rod shape-determining protein MreC